MSQTLLVRMTEPVYALSSYDSHGVFSSPRALFMFRAFGHARSSILDGGLPGWEAHGCPIETGEPKEATKSTYPIPSLDNDAVRSEAAPLSGTDT